MQTTYEYMMMMCMHGHLENNLTIVCISHKPGRRGDRLQLCYFVIIMVELGAAVVQMGFAVTRVARLVSRVVSRSLHG